MGDNILESFICSLPGLCCIFSTALVFRIIEIFLGVLSTVLSGVAAGCYIYFLYELGPTYHENDDFQQKLNAIAFLRNMENGTAFLSENNNGNTVDASFVISIIGAIIYSIHFIDSILLTFGRHFEIPKLLLPWMLMNIVSLVFSCIVVMVDFFLPPNVTALDDINSYKPAYNWIEIGCYLVAIPFQAIFVPFMKGQYLEMVKEPEVIGEEAENETLKLEAEKA